MGKNILIADSDDELTELLGKYLQANGFTPFIAHNGEIALKKALNQPFDAIILEIMLPKKNGFEVLQMLREYSKIPALFLTAYTSTIDCMVSYALGVDDFIAKPCNPRELIARLSALLRKTQKMPPNKPIIEYHPITIDTTKRLAIIHEKPLELTNTEFNILEMLIRSPGQAFSKEELTEYALGRKYNASERSIDVHISNLRNKLGNNANDEPWLKTVRGFGYAFQ